MKKIPYINLLFFILVIICFAINAFGANFSDDFSSDSDIDVLVEFHKGREPGFLNLARMERELTREFGRQVDLRTPEDLSRCFRRALSII